MNAAKNILAAGLAVIACEDNARLAGRAAPAEAGNREELLLQST
jgi:putative transposase